MSKITKRLISVIQLVMLFEASFTIHKHLKTWTIISKYIKDDKTTQKETNHYRKQWNNREKKETKGKMLKSRMK